MAPAAKKAKVELTYTGGCHCGKVEFEATGAPEWAAICHCSICRRTHSVPYAELVAFQPDNLRIVKGEDNLSMYNCNGKSQEDRYSCKDCAGRAYSMLNHLGAKAVFLQNFTTPNHGPDGKIDPKLAPSCHIFYGSGTVSCMDNLPKYETLPTAFGGDGIELPNDHHDHHDEEPNKEDEEVTYSGGCHCGKVEFEAKGAPEWAAICHCSICRRTHSAPYAELVAFQPENVSITQGEDNLTMYNCDGRSQEDRYSCKDCQGKVYSMLNHLGAKAVFLQNFTTPNHGPDGKIDAKLAPTCHIFYGSGTVSFYDTLPKYETLPTAFGGDGVELPNDYHDQWVETGNDDDVHEFDAEEEQHRNHDEDPLDELDADGEHNEEVNDVAELYQEEAPNDDENV